MYIMNINKSMNIHEKEYEKIKIVNVSVVKQAHLLHQVNKTDITNIKPKCILQLPLW